MRGDAHVPSSFRLVVMVATAVILASSNGRVHEPVDVQARMHMSVTQDQPTSHHFMQPKETIS